MLGTRNNLLEIIVRSFSPADLDAVLDIEALSYENPWNERQFTRWLRRKNIICFAATHKDKVVGFSLVEVFKDHFHLLDIAVHPEYRSYGAGRRLISFVTDQLATTKRAKVTIKLRETNLQAQLFMKACGFRAVEVLRKHYDDTGEDCYQMEFKVKSSTKPKDSKRYAV